jgi:hypothetical protein
MRTIAILSMLHASAALAAPTITAVTPAEGPVAGGFPVTVTGTGFSADSTIKIGGYPCTSLELSTQASEIKCIAPENLARKADVQVINADGSNATAMAAIQYVGKPGFGLIQRRAFTRFGVNSQGVTVVYKCSGCHSGANPDGRLDTRDYGQVLARVVPNKPDESKLWQEVRDGKMPPTGRQPALKDEEKQAIFDWILDGARNN